MFCQVTESPKRHKIENLLQFALETRRSENGLNQTTQSDYIMKLQDNLGHHFSQLTRIQSHQKIIKQMTYFMTRLNDDIIREEHRITQKLKLRNILSDFLLFALGLYV